MEKEYLGQTNITFKLRWNNHKSECKLPHKEKATCLSKYVWYLKRKEINFTINWSVASIASPYSRETGRCQLCTMERTLIALQDRGRGLNRRAEVLTRCWHKDKHLLTNWVGERPAPLSGQAGEEGGGAAVLHGDDGEGVPKNLSTLYGGNTNTAQDEKIVSLGGGGRSMLAKTWKMWRGHLTRINSMVVLKVEDTLLQKMLTSQDQSQEAEPRERKVIWKYLNQPFQNL